VRDKSRNVWKMDKSKTHRETKKKTKRDVRIEKETEGGK
jgi:hypothetical protein